ncbi:MAG: O-antigen ligase family protein [Verrucomicrobiota bacterium]
MTAPAPRRLPWLEKLVLFHLGAFVLFTSWAFGGQAPFARQIIVWWGTAGMALFVWGCRVHRGADGPELHPALRLLWPLWLYDVLVIVSCFNPAFVPITVDGQRSWMVGEPIAWLPAAARPELAARELWQFNGIVLSAFNLVLAVSRRSRLRVLLFVLGGNALLLAVLGTFQKLVGAKGLWFGLVESPQPRFFATFIYHNHWGAFTLLHTAACLALLFYYHRRGGYRDLWHSPVLLGAVATLLLAASVPLSASRSSTMLMGLLLGGALIHALVRVIRGRRGTGRPVLAPVAGIIATAVLAAAAIGWLGRGVIAQRTRLTSEQVAQLAEQGTLTSRLVLYRDTWRMAMAKPWFGWGLESYDAVFPIYNSQRPVERWFSAPRYREAHNDWFQSLAETGFVGTGLLALLFLSLLLSSRWRQTGSVLPRYLLAGCAIVLLYAWLEFPFANPAVMLSFCAVFCCAVRYAGLDARAQSDRR